jgi:hypothetical protein
MRATPAEGLAPGSTSLRHFAKIADGVAVIPLLGELERRRDLWDAHNTRRIVAGSPHREMSDIWVRYNDIARLDPKRPSAFNDEHVSVWYPAWSALPALRPIVFNLMAMVEGEMLGGVLITRIPAGGRIVPHRDAGWHVDYYEKLYVSLQNDPGAAFFCRHEDTTEALHPKPGEVWLFDNRKLHWVENDSATDRITLIVCIRTDRFRIGTVGSKR